MEQSSRAGRGPRWLQPGVSVLDAAARCWFEKARKELKGEKKRKKKAPFGSSLPAEMFAQAGCLQSRYPEVSAGSGTAWDSAMVRMLWC